MRAMLMKETMMTSMTDEPPTDLTALMSLDPLDLSTTPGTEGRRNLDAIIAYQRKQRLAREGGAKTKRATSNAPAVDIKALLGRVQKGPETKAGPPVNMLAQFPEAKAKATPTVPPKAFIRRL